MIMPGRHYFLTGVWTCSESMLRGPLTVANFPSAIPLHSTRSSGAGKQGPQEGDAVFHPPRRWCFMQSAAAHCPRVQRHLRGAFVCCCTEVAVILTEVQYSLR